MSANDLRTFKPGTNSQGKGSFNDVSCLLWLDVVISDPLSSDSFTEKSQERGEAKYCPNTMCTLALFQQFVLSNKARKKHTPVADKYFCVHRARSPSPFPRHFHPVCLSFPFCWAI